MSAIAIYREDALAARSQRDQLIAERDAALARAEGLGRSFARRRARIAFGRVLTLFALVMWIGTLCGISVASTLVTPLAQRLVVLLIPAGWLCALVAGAGAHFRCARRAARSLGRVERSDDPWRDLAQLTALEPVSALVARAAELERASIAWPLIGLSLLAPISLHLLVSLPFATWEFAAWIGVSAIVAGPAHIALALCAWSYARALSKRQTDYWSGWGALAFTTGVSTMPFALLFLLPPVLVFLTGALFVPFAWSRIKKLVDEERLTMGEAMIDTAGGAGVR
jgi:hypothetical protein